MKSGFFSRRVDSTLIMVASVIILSGTGSWLTEKTARLAGHDSASHCQNGFSLKRRSHIYIRSKCHDVDPWRANIGATLFPNWSIITRLTQLTIARKVTILTTVILYLLKIFHFFKSVMIEYPTTYTIPNIHHK